MSKHQSAVLVVLVTERLKRRARPIRYADVWASVTRAGFLARRGLDVLVCSFWCGWEVDRGDRVAVEFVGLRFDGAGLADRVVVVVRFRGV